MRPRNPAIYQQALTHTSYANEAGDPSSSNQRLEYLGDAVLQLVVSDWIFQRHPDLPEGEMTKLRAAVVCEPTLARSAAAVGLGQQLLLGKGEESSGGRSRPSSLADALEALIGAVYVDLGLSAARRLILKLLGSELLGAERGRATVDFKTQLQEVAQRHTLPRLSYHVVDEQGPDHHKSFVVEVRLGGSPVGTGRGRSKKEAEQQAAQAALAGLKQQGIIQ